MCVISTGWWVYWALYTWHCVVTSALTCSSEVQQAPPTHGPSLCHTGENWPHFIGSTNYHSLTTLELITILMYNVPKKGIHSVCVMLALTTADHNCNKTFLSLQHSVHSLYFHGLCWQVYSTCGTALIIGRQESDNWEMPALSPSHWCVGAVVTP